MPTAQDRVERRVIRQQPQVALHARRRRADVANADQEWPADKVIGDGGVVGRGQVGIESGANALG